MVDFVKIQLPQVLYLDKFKDLLKEKLIDEVNLETAELSAYSSCKYLGMKVQIHPHTRIIISGSIHKFYNRMIHNEDHNYDNFTYEKLLSAIDLLASKFNFDPKHAIIQNLEFGVNLNIPKCPTLLISENLIGYNYQAPSVQDFNGRGYFVEFEQSQYFLKIYNKSTQYSQQDHILRIEMKSKKSEFWTSGERWSLEDLKDCSILRILAEKLTKYVDRLLICDNDINDKVFMSSHREKILEYKNPNYWVTQKKKGVPRLDKNLKSFRTLLADNNLDNTYKRIIELTESKLLNFIVAACHSETAKCPTC